MRFRRKWMKTLLCVLIVPLPEGSSWGRGSEEHILLGWEAAKRCPKCSRSPSSLGVTGKTLFIEEGTLVGSRTDFFNWVKYLRKKDKWEKAIFFSFTSSLTYQLKSNTVLRRGEAENWTCILQIQNLSSKCVYSAVSPVWKISQLIKPEELQVDICS